MSTFPRRVKSPAAASVTLATTTAVSSPYLTRGTSFDAGINSSAAWTEHLERELDSLSLSDEEKGPGAGRYGVFFSSVDRTELKQPEDGVTNTELPRGKSARALYDFDGKEEYNELKLKAGEDIEVLTEDLAEGWSLARIPLLTTTGEDEDTHAGEVGLVPRSYFEYTQEVESEEPEEISDYCRIRDASSHSATPRASIALPSFSTPPPTVPTSLQETTSSMGFPPLLPQNTGEWFRQQLQLSAMRRSLLGGKSINRFSSFVTSGAEEFILKGSLPPVLPEDDLALSNSAIEGLPLLTDAFHTRERTEASVLADRTESEKHYIEVGPTWKSKIPPFHVRVHSPEKRLPVLEAGNVGAYTVYNVTSVFSTPSSTNATLESSWHERFSSIVTTSSDSSDGTVGDGDGGGHIMTVQRRFSHFVFLHNALTRLLPGIALPPLPEKQYAGRFSEAFVEARRGELERYINKIVRHPVARCTEVVMFFLGCDNDVEWKRQLPHHLHRTPDGPSFYARIYHPAFHVDAEDAEETVERFQNHTRAVSRGVQQFRNIYGKVRAARIDMSNAERLLSYSLLSLITSTPLSSATSIPEEEEEGEEDNFGHLDSRSSKKRESCRQKKGLLDADGAWCWRDDCADCLRLTKCMQKTAETFQGVADLYESHARNTMLTTHESLKSASHPNSIYAPILDIHKAALEKYKDATETNEDVASRCETVLNTTLAEFDDYHSQKKEDFERITKEHLDNEILFYEKVLNRLRTTRALFDVPQQEHELTMPGPRFPSVYERDLQEPKLSTTPLPMPCPHVLDPSPLRPVSSAIQGVGAIFNSGSNLNCTHTDRMSVTNGSRASSADTNGRGSVFSRFW